MLSGIREKGITSEVNDRLKQKLLDVRGTPAVLNRGYNRNNIFKGAAAVFALLLLVFLVYNSLKKPAIPEHRKLLQLKQ